MSTNSTNSTDVTIKHEGNFWVVYVNGFATLPRYATQAQAEAFAATL